MQNSPRNYFQRAFSDQHNVILLIGSVVLALAFASFLPLLVGFVAELLFLVICPRLPAFRAWVDARDGAVHRLEVERELKGELGSLGPAYRLRFDAFSRLLDEVVGRLAAQRMFEFDGLAAVRQQFDSLLRSALSLLQTQQTVSAAIAEIPALELAQEVARLDRVFAAERDLELRMGLRQQALAAQRRLSQREELEKTRVKADMDLSTIEKGAAYLKSRAAEQVSPEQMLTEVRSLLSDVAAPSVRVPTLSERPTSTAALSAPPRLAR
jgi:hypothetical protein